MEGLLVVLVLVGLGGVAFIVHELRENRNFMLSRMDRVDGRLDTTLQDATARMTSIGAELQAVHDSSPQLKGITRGRSRYGVLLECPAARGGFGATPIRRLLQ